MFLKALFAVLLLLTSVSATAKPHRFAERQEGASKIQLANEDELCVTVMRGGAVVGAPIQISTCFDDSDPYAHLQRFTCSEEDQGGFLSIALECDPNLCIDRGSDDSDDGSGLQLQECTGGTTSAQNWKHIDQQILSYFDGTQKCLDVQEGSEHYQGAGEPYASEKSLQTWPCFEGNTNQMWKLSQA
ncbi:hypothetical protein L486_00561 [Kwoniella mangroviensis CBS 10435]|uniref:Ricin B lectin domain-containing protein n=1 Tax=Kwoniella mangroviensis CBS 10435 TaxID=1331196 RepID=A0A1B9IZG3_9TREE|nr:hypothetical protein L486_00561 [Kwoniella mangroviensis CBS 10435]